jgi:hypothetical protein
MRALAENMKVVSIVAPVDSNGAAQGGNFNFHNMRNYPMCSIFVHIGAHSGTAAAFTIRQAKNVEGNGSKALSFTKYYQSKPTASPPETSDRWDEMVAASDTFNIAANTVYEIPVKGDMLDVDNGFDCIRAQLIAPDAATLISMYAVFHGGPAGQCGTLHEVPSVKVNRMPN